MENWGTQVKTFSFSSKVNRGLRKAFDTVLVTNSVRGGRTVIPHYLKNVWAEVVGGVL